MHNVTGTKIANPRRDRTNHATVRAHLRADRLRQDERRPTGDTFWPLLGTLDDNPISKRNKSQLLSIYCSQPPIAHLASSVSTLTL